MRSILKGFSKLALLYLPPAPSLAAQRLDAPPTGPSASIERGMANNRGRGGQDHYSAPRSSGYDMNQSRSFLPGVAGQAQQEGYRAEPTYFPGTQPSYTTPQTPVYPSSHTVGYVAPRQPQPYPSFNTPDSGLYNVPPQTQPMAFESPPYQRPSAVSTTEYGPYSTGSLQTPTLQQHLSSGSSGGYQNSPSDQGQLQPDYNSQMGGIPEITNDNYQEPPAMEAAYATYQTALKQIFQNILDGRLQVGARSLLEISEWLLGHVKELGKLSISDFGLVH